MRITRSHALPWANLILVADGFCTAVYFLKIQSSEIDELPDLPMAISVAVTILAVWVGLWLSEFPHHPDDSIVDLLQQISAPLGLAFLLQALFGYAGLRTMLPLDVMVAGAAIAAALLTLAGRFVYPHFLPPEAPVLYLGFGHTAEAIQQVYRRPALGALDRTPSSVPEGVPLLGEPTDVASVVKKRAPGEIIVDLDRWGTAVAPSLLLDLRLSGVTVRDSASLYETLYRRVCTGRIRPSDFFLSTKLDPPRHHLAVQAIYSNLIGLALLVFALPLIVVCAILVRVFGGAGPVLERVVCSGFKEVPFERLRFRTSRSDAMHRMTAIGRILTVLRLKRMPELFNIVRGEMVVVGPEPVRRQYVQRLSALIPFYPHRFTVKPGLMSWARVHRNRREIVRILAELEYDLYYVKNVSMIFDLEIALASVARFFR